MTNSNNVNSNIVFKGLLLSAVSILSYIIFIPTVDAASLALTPSTGVYTSGNTFTVRVAVNTEGSAVNAAEGTLFFSPNELSVVSVNRTGSIFNLWVAEPTFSNSAGTINFSGGLPSGYSGKTGTIMNITFRAKGSGPTKVNFRNGSVLANDGKGTNVLTSMNGGSFTIQAKSLAPEPEIIEYVAPANTPPAPKIISGTHPDTDKWYQAKTAELSWKVPSDVVAMRTLLDDIPTSIPTKVYSSPVNKITLDQLDEGESYFHIQFRNDEGWGRVTHYKLAVDTQNPTVIDITNAPDSDLASPVQVLNIDVNDETSGIAKYLIKLDSSDPYEVTDISASGTVALPALEPGYHTVIVEAVDWAGNSIVGTHSFTIAAFDKPLFTHYPSEISEEVIPVIKGVTRPNSDVEITLSKLGGSPLSYTTVSDDQGEFIFIPEGTFSTGVYDLVAKASDKFGAQSELSDVVRIAVQKPGYLRIGSLFINALSVLVPLITLLFILFIGSWRLWVFASRFRKTVRAESAEALEILNIEFRNLNKTLEDQKNNIENSRKTKKLTKVEGEMIDNMNNSIKVARERVEKEIRDVTRLTSKK